MLIWFTAWSMRISINEWGQYEWIQAYAKVAMWKQYLLKFVSASSESWLEMQILGPHPSSFKPETLWVSPRNLCFNTPFRWFWCGFRFENHWGRVKRASPHAEVWLPGAFREMRWSDDIVHRAWRPPQKWIFLHPGRIQLLVLSKRIFTCPVYVTVRSLRMSTQDSIRSLHSASWIPNQSWPHTWRGTTWCAKS